MAYESPTHDILRVGVARDLHDPDMVVFGVETLTDFINNGIAELNETRPLETQVEVAGDDIAQTIEDLPLTYVFAVESSTTRAGESIQRSVPPHDAAVPGWRAGWDFFGGKLDLGTIWAGSLMGRVEAFGGANVVLRVSGYSDRPPLIADEDVAPFSSLQEEWFVRRFARVAAFKSLEADRSLFQQWQAAANNTDVSPTQLTGMRASTEGEFDRLRKTMRRLRRPVMG